MIPLWGSKNWAKLISFEKFFWTSKKGFHFITDQMFAQSARNLSFFGWKKPFRKKIRYNFKWVQKNFGNRVSIKKNYVINYIKMNRNWKQILKQIGAYPMMYRWCYLTTFGWHSLHRYPHLLSRYYCRFQWPMLYKLMAFA